MATSLMRTLAPVYFTSSETPNLVASNIAELILSLTLANGTVHERFWTGLDHLPEVVPFRLERFALEPFQTCLHYGNNRSAA